MCRELRIADYTTAAQHTSYQVGQEIIIRPHITQNNRRNPKGCGDNFIRMRTVRQSIFNTARNADCGTSTEPIWRMRFLPAFCFSSSLRLRDMSPP